MAPPYKMRASTLQKKSPQFRDNLPASSLLLMRTINKKIILMLVATYKITIPVKFQPS
jgi:hypothetical protein